MPLMRWSFCYRVDTETNSKTINPMQQINDWLADNLSLGVFQEVSFSAIYTHKSLKTS